jgi:hypothetical protein
MQGRRIIEELVPQVSPNAQVVDVTERGGSYRVTIAGTTTLTVQCEVPRAAVEAAEHADGARAELASLLKECADHVVAPVPDGRG